MSLLHPQLEAFLAVIEEGSFDRAAKRLAVTPSALSQRIKGLEDRLGTVVLKRESPVVPTQAGQKLLRRAQAMQLLETEALAEFSGAQSGDGIIRLTILVNNDSLATWFTHAAADFAAQCVKESETSQARVSLDIRTDDQDHALESLRNGTAIAVVTSENSPVSGARLRALGTMRYHAWVSPSLLSHTPGAALAEKLRVMPIVCFDHKDALQARFLALFGIEAEAFGGVSHFLPSPSAMLEASARGLGWSMAPEMLARPWVEKGELVMLDETRFIDVPLYWQCAGIRSKTLDRLSRIVMDTAAQYLMPLESKA